jgi:hypothetical protein
MFKELIPVYAENHKTYKYKSRTNWLLKQLLHIFTIEFKE